MVITGPFPVRARKARSNNGLVPWLFVIPALLLIAIFFALPIAQAVFISLSHWIGAGPVVPEDLSNYVSALSSPRFYNSLLLTLGFATASATGIVVIATLLAAAISQNVRGSRFYRVVWFIPGIAPAAAVAVYWTTAFQPGIGTVNVLGALIGLDPNSAPLASAQTAILPIIFVSIWSGVGFAFILILGGMEQIPVAVYEAAKIDGASAVRQFVSITLPLVRPVLSITATLNLIWAFNNFTSVWGMTNGGPGYATTTLPVLVYRTAFVDGDFGSGTAIAVIAGSLLLALGFLVLRLSRAKDTEQP